MGKRISGYWNKGDKIASDRVRVNVIAQRMAAERGKEWHGGTPLTFDEAKDLAIAMLYDFDYREWRSAQMDAMQSNAEASALPTRPPCSESTTR